MREAFGFWKRGKPGVAPGRRPGVAGAGPDPDEGDRGGQKAQGKAPPHPCGSVVEWKREEVAEGRADGPEADELDDERRQGAAGSAEGSGGGGLDAVKKLKGGGYEEQGNSGVDDGFTRREEAGDPGGREQQNDGSHKNKDGAGEDAAPPGGGDLGSRAEACAEAANGMAYADGGGAGDGERDHEGGAGALEGDFMAR